MKITPDELIELVSKALGVEVTPGSNSENTEEWDSLGHLSILQALDEKTGGASGSVSNLGSANSYSELENTLREAKLLS
jgi:hypothetical protein